MNVYSNPLVDRYASKEINNIFSNLFKFSTWRKLWFVLAESQHELGLNNLITTEILDKMKNNLIIDEEGINKAQEFEKKFKHDVMSHVHAFGEECGEEVRKIIHLGATSCYVGDNTDLIQMKEGLKIIRSKLLRIIFQLRNFSLKYKDLPCLGFTHFQPSQLTTVGKRATIWLQDFQYDLEILDFNLSILNKSFRGVKGTTGTQATFLELFNGDHSKVKLLDDMVAKKMSFDSSIFITGQTYTRKIDSIILETLSLIAQSAHKISVDLRLLANLKEIEEPFGSEQIGSSAMAYKRNPMRCERICSLSRFVISLSQNGAYNHSNQWMERTLDDSANRRLSIGQSFLATDGILKLLINITNGFQVYEYVIHQHCMNELPFMITEKILMECVKNGGDRQHFHELIRQHSIKAIEQVKKYGKENDLIERIKSDFNFECIHKIIDSMIDPLNFVGRAPMQVQDYIESCIDPILSQYKEEIDSTDSEILI